MLSFSQWRHYPASIIGMMKVVENVAIFLSSKAYNPFHLYITTPLLMFDIIVFFQTGSNRTQIRISRNGKGSFLCGWDEFCDHQNLTSKWASQTDIQLHPEFWYWGRHQSPRQCDIVAGYRRCYLCTPPDHLVGVQAKFCFGSDWPRSDVRKRQTTPHP